MRKNIVLLWVMIFAISLSAAEWGPLSGPAPVVGAAGPVKTSRYFVVQGVLKDGTFTIDIPIDSPAGALMMVAGVHVSSVTLDRGVSQKARRYVTPDLRLMDIPETGTRVELGPVTPGFHRLTLVADQKNAPVQLVVAEPESPVTMDIAVQPLAAHAGDPVTVTAKFPEDVKRASVQATLDNGTTIVLLDDGAGPDQVAGDGRYTAMFVAPEPTGQPATALRLDASGVLEEGIPFRRTATAAVMVSQPVTGLADSVNGDLMGLSVRLQPASGRFRVEAIYAAGDRAVAYARETVTLNGETGEVVLPRPAIAMMADHAVVRVLNVDSLGLETEVSVPLTALEQPGSERPGRINRWGESSGPELPASKAAAAARFGDTERNH